MLYYKWHIIGSSDVHTTGHFDLNIHGWKKRVLETDIIQL